MISTPFSVDGAGRMRYATYRRRRYVRAALSVTFYPVQKRCNAMKKFLSRMTKLSVLFLFILSLALARMFAGAKRRVVLAAGAR